MNLLEIRTEATKKSGRYDLINPSDYTDNGMDFHINAGQKYLDKLVSVPENFAQIYQSLAANAYSINFQYHCRAIHSVFINDDTNRWELTRISLEALKSTYDQLASATSTGKPCYYALANLRSLETTAREELGIFINSTFDEYDLVSDYRGIILVPPADESYVVEIAGKFSQLTLTEDTDENYWSIEYPHLLIMSALRSIEVFNRNTEGVKDWSASIFSETKELDFDLVEEESYGTDQMEG